MNDTLTPPTTDPTDKPDWRTAALAAFQREQEESKRNADSDFLADSNAFGEKLAAFGLDARSFHIYADADAPRVLHAVSDDEVATFTLDCRYDWQARHTYRDLYLAVEEENEEDGGTYAVFYGPIATAAQLGRILAEQHRPEERRLVLKSQEKPAPPPPDPYADALECVTRYQWDRTPGGFETRMSALCLLAVASELRKLNDNWRRGLGVQHG